MAKLVWGRDEQLQFADQGEYYYSLGLLCHPGRFNIVYEPNKLTNSWEDAYKIQCANCQVPLPQAFQDALRSQDRINNNEYVDNLFRNHNFKYKEGTISISTGITMMSGRLYRMHILKILMKDMISNLGADGRGQR